MFNTILIKGKYPAHLDSGKSIPVYKSKNKLRNTSKSYQYTTTVNCISKVVEYIIAAQTERNIGTHMPGNIFGYRKNEQPKNPSTIWYEKRLNKKSEKRIS